MRKMLVIMRKRLMVLLITLFCAANLSACLDETTSKVTLAVPGKYLGPADPLVDKGSQQAVLSERLQGQLDR